MHYKYIFETIYTINTVYDVGKSQWTSIFKSMYHKNWPGITTDFYCKPTDTHQYCGII